EERVPDPVRKARLLQQVLDVLQRRMQRPERRAVDRPPRAVELGVGADGRDQHPVERKQRADHEDRERDVEVHPLLPAPLDHHAASSLRRYLSCSQTTMNSTGSMKSEMAAPSPSRPVATPIW